MEDLRIFGVGGGADDNKIPLIDLVLGLRYFRKHIQRN